MTRIVAIGGGSGSGKTTLARALKGILGDKVSVISHDSYYLDRSNLSVEERKLVNYDVPEALDEALFLEHLEKLERGEAVEVPLFDFATHTRLKGSLHVEPAPLVIVEGIMVLSIPSFLKHYSLKVYVDADEDVRLARRILRDTSERGRKTEDIIRQYLAYVKPAFDEFVAPTARECDIIFRNNGTTGLEMGDVEHLAERIEEEAK